MVIVIVNYHGFEDCVDCVTSIVENDPISPHIVLIDNSQPNENRLEELKTIHSNITILYSDENLGFGRANNLGITWANEHLNYKYLLLLNNDTLVEKNALSRMIQCFSEDSSIGLVTCKTMFATNPEIVWYGGGSVDYSHGWPVLVDYKSLATENGANRSKFVTFVAGCVILFSKEALQSLDGFDERMFMYVEDLELSVRAKRKNIRMWYTAEATILHRVQGSRVKEDQHLGIHPKNPNVAFHFYHKKLNQWIAFNSLLTGKELRRFRRNYWYNFTKTLVRLFVFSPKRFKVVKTASKVIRNIRKREYEH